MAMPPKEPAPELGELAKEVPAPSTAIEMGKTQPTPGQHVRPLPTPGTVAGGVADAGETLSGAGVRQPADQTTGLRPEVRDLYDRLWGSGGAAPEPAPAEEAPAPTIAPPGLEPDL